MGCSKDNLFYLSAIYSRVKSVKRTHAHLNNANIKDFFFNFQKKSVHINMNMDTNMALFVPQGCKKFYTNFKL